MKCKPSNPPEPQEGLKSPAARVSITEKAPDPVQTEKSIKDDPARMTGLVREWVKYMALLDEAAPLVQKTKQNAESRKRAIGRHVNENKRQNAQGRKLIALKIAARLMQQDLLRLPRMVTELARRTRTQWPKREYPPPSVRTFRRWLTENS